MDHRNITGYGSVPGEYLMYRGKASLGSGFYLANYDERFYHYIGMARSFQSVPEFIHPDDVDAFLEAVPRLDQCPQHLILRLLSVNDQYRLFHVLMKYNGKVLDGFRSFDICATQIMAITDKYMDYLNLVEKYRGFMTLFDGIFLEYEYGTDMLKFYEYRNRQSRVVFHAPLEEFRQQVEENARLSQEQKAEFQIMYEMLRKGRDHAKVDVDAALFLETEGAVRYEIRFNMVYQDDVREMAIGLVDVISRNKPKQSYYLTDSAFDPGTGILNKRAINEYAIEKIQSNTPGLHLVIMDVDDFKHINDNFGHMFGDEVLSRTAEIIKGVVKTRGAVGRFGGDEFMVVLEGIDSEDTLRRIISTIAHNIEWAFSDVEGLKVTASIGISKFPDDGTTYEELFQKADKSVYIAKEKGKNRYIIYDEKKHGAVVKEDDNRLNIGFKATVSDDKKNAAASDMTMRLYREGTEALVPVMEQMQSYFDIDGIAVYTGENLMRTHSVGKYVNPIQSLSFAKDAGYQEFFDKRGFCDMNAMQKLENKAPFALEEYRKQENGKFLQCQALRDGVPVAVVSFDIFNRKTKQGTTDLGLIRLVGRLIAEIAAKG